LGRSCVFTIGPLKEKMSHELVEKDNTHRWLPSFTWPPQVSLDHQKTLVPQSVHSQLIPQGSDAYVERTTRRSSVKRKRDTKSQDGPPTEGQLFLWSHTYYKQQDPQSYSETKTIQMSRLL
jgi:hypothetical protein